MHVESESGPYSKNLSLKENTPILNIIFWCIFHYPSFFEASFKINWVSRSSSDDSSRPFLWGEYFGGIGGSMLRRRMFVIVVVFCSVVLLILVRHSERGHDVC